MERMEWLDNSGEEEESGASRSHLLEWGI